MQMHLCEWEDFENRLEHIKQGIEHGQPMADPFTMLGIADQPALQRKTAELEISNNYPEDHVLGPLELNGRHTKIRIGYFSADLRNHPVSYLMAEILKSMIRISLKSLHSI